MNICSISTIEGGETVPRPPCCRRIQGVPEIAAFKPAGIPACDLEDVVLTLDELEAIRLADQEGLYHQDAAARMEVSRATFGRVLASARGKVAEALLAGKTLRFAGGPVLMDDADPPGRFGKRCQKRGGRGGCPGFGDVAERPPEE